MLAPQTSRTPGLTQDSPSRLLLSQTVSHSLPLPPRPPFACTLHHAHPPATTVPRNRPGVGLGVRAFERSVVIRCSFGRRDSTFRFDGRNLLSPLLLGWGANVGTSSLRVIARVWLQASAGAASPLASAALLPLTSSPHFFPAFKMASASASAR